MASGGMRPTAPQNNPNNISLTGGAGQNPKNTELKYRGMGYGQTGQTNAQARMAPGVAGTAGAAAAPGRASSISVGKGGAPVVPLTAPTQFENESIFSGSTLPGGLDFTDLNLPKQPVGDPDLDTVIAYYPVMRYWANQPDAPQATKDYVRYLGTIIPQ